MAIDSHMHINSLVLNDMQKYIDKVNNNLNIDSVINVGMNIETSKEAINISNTNDKFYSTIGIHPLYLKGENVYSLYDLSNNDKVVAIGEIGFDDKFNNYEEQKLYLILQIRIANELKLPVVIHSSNSNIKIIDIFERYVKPEYGCVFHCFQPDIQVLEYLVNHGIYISFAGRITYKNASRSIEIIKNVPNNLFLVETDSPFISPKPFRDEINTSDNLKYIIEKISQVKNISYNDVEEITCENTRKLFKRIR